jgi:hypothetical protein
MHPNMRRLLGLDTPVVFHKPTWPTPVDIPTTESLLIDAAAMLAHYTSGRPDNWDGSTKRQAQVLIAQINSALQEQKS